MTEHEKALAWRQSLKLSRPELARMTGYSISSIICMERGTTAAGEPIDPAAWQRYKLACAAVSAGLTTFAWGAVTVTIKPASP